MTKQEQIQYLQKYVASQGTQAGLSITPLLEAIINGNDNIFAVTVESNAESTKKVTNPQEDINNFIAAANVDPLHNIPKVYFNGAILSFAQIMVLEDEITGYALDVEGKFVLTLSTTEGNSQLVYTSFS